VSTFTVLSRLASLDKTVKADTIRTFGRLFVVLVVFDFHLRMEIMEKSAISI
jgi:hypothetical protein